MLEWSYDESVAAPHIIEAVRQANDEGFHAVVLAAFCEPGQSRPHGRSPAIPVFGLEETTLAVALVLGNKFGILTEKPHKTAVKAQHVRKMGLDSRFAAVRARAGDGSGRNRQQRS